ncbi:hypothetical protein KR222_008575, partial [Zaprionus bogoriensis]
CLPDRIDDETKFVILQNDNMEPTVLDCDYNISDTASFLTVKWFRNNKTVYQWIRGKPPTPIPGFENDVDSSYENSKDRNKQYSSLALIKPSINATGIYKCFVQTELETITIQKSVQVIDVRNYSLNLNRYKIQNKTQLECSISNVFPKPTLTITSEDSEIVKVLANNPHQNEDGYFNATTSAAVQDNEEDNDSYKCVVNFDGYPENFTTLITSGSCNRFLKLRLSFLFFLISSLSCSL